MPSQRQWPVGGEGKSGFGFLRASGKDGLSQDSRPCPREDAAYLRVLEATLQEAPRIRGAPTKGGGKPGRAKRPRPRGDDLSSGPDSLRGSPVKLGATQRRLARPPAQRMTQTDRRGVTVAREASLSGPDSPPRGRAREAEPEAERERDEAVRERDELARQGAGTGGVRTVTNGGDVDNVGKMMMLMDNNI